MKVKELGMAILLVSLQIIAINLGFLNFEATVLTMLCLIFLGGES